MPASCLGTPDWFRFAFDAVTTDSWKNPSYLYVEVTRRRHLGHEGPLLAADTTTAHPGQASVSPELVSR